MYKNLLASYITNKGCSDEVEVGIYKDPSNGLLDIKAASRVNNISWYVSKDIDSDSVIRVLCSLLNTLENEK